MDGAARAGLFVTVVGDDEAVHLWLLSAPRAPDAAEQAACLAVLDAAERARFEALSLPSVRWEYLRARAFVRRALSWYAGGDPGRWRFENNAWGRPFVSGVPGVFFNLSHTRGMLCVALARDPEVGVDVEWLERPGETVAVAGRYFAPAELAALKALETSAQRDAFFDYWTLKEAYIKARGLGLAIPLKRFAFARGEPITVRFDPELDDDASSWDFACFDPSPGHRVALAMRRVAGLPRPWTLHRAASPVW